MDGVKCQSTLRRLNAWKPAQFNTRKLAKAARPLKWETIFQHEVHGSCTSIHKKTKLSENALSVIHCSMFKVELELINPFAVTSYGSCCHQWKIPTHLKVLMILNFEDIAEERPMTVCPSCFVCLSQSSIGHHHSAVHSGRPGRHTMHSGRYTLLILTKSRSCIDFFVYSDKNYCSLAALALLWLV